LEVFVVLLIKDYSLSGNYAGLISIFVKNFSKKRAAYNFMVAQDNSEDGGAIKKITKT
jgi:hypothetical protein